MRVVQRASCQCSMIVRAVIAFLALSAVRARAQPSSIWVDVDASPTEEPEFEDLEADVEKRYTPELIEELQSAKEDALLLYTEFTAHASQYLKLFVRNLSKLEDETRRGLEPGLLEKAPENCRVQFDKRLKKAKYGAHRAAVFSAENHHKFFLGHMIVFRMHLNKSEEYVKRSRKIILSCGIRCETQPKVKRWRRQALDELSRVRSDMAHSRPVYRDLLTHAQRRLNTLRRHARAEADAAKMELKQCAESSNV